MKRVFSLCVFQLLLLLLTVGAQSPPKNSKLAFEEIQNTWDGRLFNPRYIYILTNEAQFNRQNIEEVFISLSCKYPTPESATIKIFTDLDRLRGTIALDNPGFSISYLETEAGRAAQLRHELERTPRTKGLYAEYVRTQTEVDQYYVYSRESDSPDVEKVFRDFLKERTRRGQACDSAILSK